MIAISPSYFGLRASPIPITAGIFIVLARIAVWELDEPYIVANPSTFSLSSCTVSLGARSSAATIQGSVISRVPLLTPQRISSTRSETSFTSAARPCIYASSIDANICAKLSAVVETAYSAFTLCVRIIPSIDSR